MEVEGLALETAPELRRLPILLAGADCTGDEESLAACPGGTLGDVREAALGPCSFGRRSVALVCFSDAASGADGYPGAARIIHIGNVCKEIIPVPHEPTYAAGMRGLYEHIRLDIHATSSMALQIIHTNC